MESVNKKVMLIAVVMALFTSFLIYIYINDATANTETGASVSVYVAAKTLPAKQKISANDIRETKVSPELINPKAVTNLQDIIGKRLKESVIEGEQILRDRLVDDEKTELAYVVPEGKRAVSVNINEQIAAANLIKPGDSVDVIASFEKEEIEDKSSKTVYPRITKTIIQNVLVLAFGQNQDITDDEAKELPKTVTLAVSPQDAEKLVYASEYAAIRLALKPVDDKKEASTSGAIRSDMVPDKGVKVLPK